MAKANKLKIIPLGGLGEIGKNITVFEYKEDIIIVDCGMTFPEDEMLGVDIVIPDITYLIKNKDKIKGLILTHGHEDHVGAIPYVLKKINIPIYGTKLTLGLLSTKLKEHNLGDVELNTVKAGDTIRLGEFQVEFIRTNHSIPDSVALAITTNIGTIIHTGDFKIDYTPISGEVIDLNRFAELGSRGVLALLSDSTNVTRRGYTMSERSVGDTFKDLFSKADSRIIVATFASNVHRVQQIIDAAELYDRKVVVSGRSMVNTVTVATELGYLRMEEGTLIDINEMNRYRKDELVIITTGSQGEPMSALTRIAFSEHRKIELFPDDLVIISASPIPGNEKTISRIINKLIESGTRVVYEDLAEVHVSGHACQEELKLIHTLVKPKFFMPVHGEQRHLKMHADISHSLGTPKENIFILENGQTLELTKNTANIGPSVQAGNILVDGLGVGDVGNIVLRDRKHLSEDGLIVVVVTMSKQDGAVIAGPDIISRGFVYVRESEDLMEEARCVVKKVLSECEKKKITDWATLKSNIRESLRDYIYEKIKRNPMILPIIMEV
ncbi:ribonuclease J [Paratissierella segnis]|uniref:Ribonuclease J n=1 Tax=Paratissierella segnis TaxID=2763679 RepID=A0A926EVV3_9FIRM|nr:ribonuclease J [Paratissierella segnis]MBC8588467.1 ribonuclease J [Paratissierella segnis]